MHISTLTIENFRCFGEGDNRLELSLRPGLTALVGENDAGKTAVIDALRFALGTTDQEWFRLDDTDFRPREKAESSSPNAKRIEYKEIRIVCKFENLSDEDKRAFVEYLSYEANDGAHRQVLYINWTAQNTMQMRQGRRFRRIEVHSGKNGDGPSIAREAHEFLRATYLRPLRDAEESLLAGRGSRLSQVLRHSEQIREGEDTWDDSMSLEELNKLSVQGIANLVNHLLEKHKGVEAARGEIDKNLNQLAIVGDNLASTIAVGAAKALPEAQLTELLEKLDLRLGTAGKPGLGSGNLLFIACELLLLAKESVGNRLLLIEEPEAHLHPQRQLRVMKYLQDQAERKKGRIQIIVTTHSPNLASVIKLNNLVIIRNGRAFSMAQGQTKLNPSDCRFLERFLDVTKANLFFARGVVIVEGDAENILLPTLATLIDRDFTTHGVSIVNVGGVGLRRYAKIFQRADEKKDRVLVIPVACVTDMDVMPDCAGKITGKELPTKSALNLSEHRDKLRKKASGQSVETFVSDEWTLEYDLAYAGLAEDLYVAAALAKKAESLAGSPLKAVVKACHEAQREFEGLKETAKKAVDENKANNCSRKEVLAAHVYAQFTKGTRASKAIAAQYLVERLQRKGRKEKLTAEKWRMLLPNYLTDAIDYVTSGEHAEESPPDEGATAHA